MKILALLGSPNDNGNTAQIIKIICEAAKSNGHGYEVVHLCKENIHPCMACGTCKTEKVEFCIQSDAMTNSIIPKMLEADCLIIGSPVYFGQITGLTKTFIDRWYTFFNDKFEIRFIDTKKVITVVTCGAPTEVFQKVSDYLKYWLGSFFQMEIVGQIMEGDFNNNKPLSDEVKKKAKELGASLL